MCPGPDRRMGWRRIPRTPPGTSTSRSPPKASAGADGQSPGRTISSVGSGGVAAPALDEADDPAVEEAREASGVRADGMFCLPVRRMRTTANATTTSAYSPAAIPLYLRPPTFWRPGWSLCLSLTLHEPDKRRSEPGRIDV